MSSELITASAALRRVRQLDRWLREKTAALETALARVKALELDLAKARADEAIARRSVTDTARLEERLAETLRDNTALRETRCVFLDPARVHRALCRRGVATENVPWNLTTPVYRDALLRALQECT